MPSRQSLRTGVQSVPVCRDPSLRCDQSRLDYSNAASVTPGRRVPSMMLRNSCVIGMASRPSRSVFRGNALCICAIPPSRFKATIASTTTRASSAAIPESPIRGLTLAPHDGQRAALRHHRAEGGAIGQCRLCGDSCPQPSRQCVTGVYLRETVSALRDTTEIARAAWICSGCCLDHHVVSRSQVSTRVRTRTFKGGPLRGIVHQLLAVARNPPHISRFPDDVRYFSHGCASCS